MTGPVLIVNFGCKVNQYEGQLIREALVRRGVLLTDDWESARTVVINGCAVTSRAQSKAEQTAKKALKEGKEVLITACGASAILLQGKKVGQAELVPQLEKDRFFDLPEGISGFYGHTRAFVKVQDGCSMGCTYCYIPKLRGKARLRDPQAIEADLLRLGELGVKEVVFTGICMGWGGQDLVSLARFAREKAGIPRVRLSSIEPFFVSDAIIQACKEGLLCEHLHIPFQSGSSEILRRMGRPYDRDFILRLVERIRKEVPDVGISTDIMVGFPGEGEREFQETLSLLDEIRPMRVHAFPFSPRPGTPAERFDRQVSGREKKERVARVLDRATVYARGYAERFVGRELEVLFEDEEEGLWTGTARNYLKIRFASPQDLENRIETIRIESMEQVVI